MWGTLPKWGMAYPVVQRNNNRPVGPASIVGLGKFPQSEPCKVIPVSSRQEIDLLLPKRFPAPQDFRLMTCIPHLVS